MKHYSHREAGVVSLFTVLFFTILITVLTVGFLRVMISEQRQSTDDDLTSRAYYAAESGVEDAKRALLQYYPNPADRPNLNADTCEPPVGYSGDIEPELSVGYSCMLMDLEPEDIQAQLPGDGTMQWRLTPESGQSYDRIRISWHRLSSDIDGPNIGFRTNTLSLPRASEWRGCPTFGICNPLSDQTYPFAALMRVQMFGSIVDGFETTQDQLEAFNGIGYINPNMLDSVPEAVIDYTTHLNDDATNPGTPINTFCTTDPDVYDGYACRTTITVNPLAAGLMDMNLRLKGIYDTNGTEVRVEMLNGNNVIGIANAQAEVDVTGRAGDVFRRIQTRVNLPGAIDANLLPEYVIDSGDDICKRFEVSRTNEVLNGCVIR